MLKTSGLRIFFAVFSKLFRELSRRPSCQKYFASAIFAQGTPLLYGACSFKLLMCCEGSREEHAGGEGGLIQYNELSWRDKVIS